MELSEKHLQIIRGEICPYCGNKSKLIESKEIYGRDYGLLYICRPCDAYVGVHKGTTNAKGRLANAELRKLKIEAHKHFDTLWGEGKMKRKSAYKWLSKQLNIPEEYTHIGMFSEKTLKEVIKHCEEWNQTHT